MLVAAIRVLYESDTGKVPSFRVLEILAVRNHIRGVVHVKGVERLQGCVPVGIDLPGDSLFVQRLPDSLGIYGSLRRVSPPGRGCGERVQTIGRSAAQQRRKEPVRSRELRCQPVVIGQVSIVVISHRAQAFLVAAAAVAGVVGCGVHEAVHGSVAPAGIMTIELTMTLVPSGADLFVAGGVLPAKWTDDRSVVKAGITCIGSQAVYIGTQTLAHAKIVQFTEIIVERTVLLQHVNNVVHCMYVASAGRVVVGLAASTAASREKTD